MAGRELGVKRVVHATPDEVWAVITDLENASETLRGVSAVEVIEGPAYGVGTRWRETRRILGMEETQTMEVAESDPPLSTTVTARSRGVDYRTVFTLEPVEDGTLLTVRFGATHPDPNLLQRLTATLFNPVGAAVTTRLLNQDLADIAARAERPDPR